MRIVAKPDDDHLRNQRRPSAFDLAPSIDCAQADFGVLKADAKLRATGARQDEVNALLALIDQLPACQREVLLMVDVHGYDYAQAMQLLALPMNTVKSRLSQARTALRDGLIEAGRITGLPA